MRLDEFETVGNTVKAFASDNATVVIGTSLDPDMADEIRVTVVATGIGNEKKPDITLVAGGKAKVAPVAQPQTQPQTAPAQQPTVNKVEEKAAPTLQEKPQVTPQPTTSAPSGSSAGQSAAPKADKESGYLDIPAFLRRQAD
jgi:cell division protein FtsZ